MSDTGVEETLKTKLAISPRKEDDILHEPSKPIVTVDEWEEACKDQEETVILQIGSDWCERCPAMHKCIGALKTDYKFTWVYSDASDTELTEHFTFTKLPAVVIASPRHEGAFKAQAVSEHTVQTAVREMCTAVFHLDADF